MKITNHTVVINLTIFFLLILSLSGCGSTGMQRSERTTSTMDNMNNDIKLIVVQLDATGASLDDLMRRGQNDVKKAFDLYTNNVVKMEAIEKQLIKHADEMKTRGKEYFEEWQKEGNEYKNSQIQQLSEQRRNELSDVYSRIAQNSVGVKDALFAYVSDIKEIQKYLSNDLTKNGIDAISPISNKVVNDGDNLKYAVKNIQSAIDRARTEMAQNGK